MTKHLLVGKSVTAMLPGYWSSTLRAKEHVSRLCMLAYPQFYRLLLIWQKSPPPSGLLLAGWWSSRTEFFAKLSGKAEIVNQTVG